MSLHFACFLASMRVRCTGALDMPPIVKKRKMLVVQTTSACLNMCTVQSFHDDGQDMFLPGRNEGLRNWHHLMNAPETANDQAASYAASGRLSGRL